MASLDSVKERGRGVVVRSMRACVDRNHVPWIAKALYVSGCQLLLSRLSDFIPELCEQSKQTITAADHGDFHNRGTIRVIVSRQPLVPS